MARINFPKKLKPYLENKIKAIRRMYAPKAPRASRPGHKHTNLAAVILITGVTLVSFFLPKDEWQLLKDKLIAQPNDFQSHILLAEKLLDDRRFEEAEKELLLASKIKQSQQTSSSNQKVLGEQTQSKLEKLWQKKHYNDPVDIQKLIAAWEKIVAEKPNYADGWFELAYLNYKIYQNDKAKKYLQKALVLNPNHEPARKLENIIR